MDRVFTAFFEGWIINQQNLLQKLQSLSSSQVVVDEECKDLIAQVLAHYHQYYQEKTRAVNEDVLLMLSPPWLSSFERTILWISGFKPSMVFPLIKRSLAGNLTDEQLEKIEVIKTETRRKEKEVEDAMATVQESIAAPPIYDLMRRYQRLIDGEVSKLDEAVEKFREDTIIVVENADALRGSTVMKLVQILSPLQAIKFLAVATQFMLEAREWGRQKDAQSQLQHKQRYI